jgi:type IV pilus assembly protein PilQ
MCKRIVFIICSFLFFIASSSYANLALNKLNVVQTPAGNSILQLHFNNKVTEKPSSFMMKNPERLIIDIPKASSQLKKKPDFKSNIVQHIQTLETRHKLRLVIQLQQAINYKVTTSNKTVNIKLNESVPTKNKLPATTITELQYLAGAEPNSGKVVLDLSKTGVHTRLEKSLNKIVITFSNTQLKKDLAHQYDVGDFNTPAKKINLHQENQHTKLVIRLKQNAEVAAYQRNKQFIVQILPKDSVNKAEVKPQGKRISLNFQDVAVRQVLQVIAEFTDANMIINDDVTGNITLRLDEVPWTQALKIILDTQGLVERKIGNVILIAPATSIAAQERAQLKAQDDLEELAPLKSEIFQINYGKAAEYASALQSAGNTLLSSRGKIVVDERTNKLFIKDTSKKLNGITHYLQQTDIAVRQVEIEARIVTVDKSFERKLGISWSATGPSASGTAGKNEFTVDLGAGDIGGKSPANLALATLSKDILIGLELSALEAEGGGEILSSPRLLTADQQEAVIEQGTEIPYNEATSSGAAAIAFKQAVLRLKVVPQITPNNKILLKLEVNQDAKSKEVAGTGQPIIDTRHISTNVLVDNGETVVLGGIYERTQSHSETRVPFLSAIPILGELFKHRSVSDDRKELLIFVTPRIVHNDT